MDWDNGFCADPEVILAFSMLGATLASLTYGGVSIRKEADGSIVPYALLPSRDDPDQSGLVIFEGAVFNEDIPRVVLELLFWLSAERCQVSINILGIESISETAKTAANLRY